MRKIIVSLSKGGVAKTTTAVHLAHGLAKRGRKVLLVDTDTQGQDAVLLGVKPGLGLASVVNDAVAPQDALQEARENLWLLAGGRELAGVRKLIDMKDFGGEQTLVEALEPLEGEFDFVIVDTAPGWDSLTVNALFYGGEVLVPASLEALTLQGIGEFIRSLERVQKFHRALAFKYLVPTFLDGRVKKSAEIHGLLRSHFADKLCPPIRYNVRISEAAGLGKTVFEYAPRSAGSEDYTNLTLYIERDGNE